MATKKENTECFDTKHCTFLDIDTIRACEFKLYFFHNRFASWIGISWPIYFSYNFLETCSLFFTIKFIFFLINRLAAFLSSLSEALPFHLFRECNHPFSDAICKNFSIKHSKTNMHCVASPEVSMLTSQPQPISSSNTTFIPQEAKVRSFTSGI